MELVHLVNCHQTRRGGNRGAPNLDGRIRPLMLSEEEEAAIIAFLKTLSAPVVSYSPKP